MMSKIDNGQLAMNQVTALANAIESITGINPIARITELKQQNAELLDVIHDLADALKMVEWTSHPGGETYCPWCLNLRIEGHKNDCARKIALAQTGE